MAPHGTGSRESGHAARPTAARMGCVPGAGTVWDGRGGWAHRTTGRGDFLSEGEEHPFVPGCPQNACLLTQGTVNRKWSVSLGGAASRLRSVCSRQTPEDSLVVPW